MQLLVTVLSRNGFRKFYCPLSWFNSFCDTKVQDQKSLADVSVSYSAWQWTVEEQQGLKFTELDTSLWETMATTSAMWKMRE